MSLFWIYTIFALGIAISRGEDDCIKEEYDFIIVGTGSAGGVLLNRLSEDPTVKVLALEAGGIPTPTSEIPFLAASGLSTIMDWNYTTVPQTSCCRMYNNREVFYGRGHALGGTSSINFLVYTRGNKRDYDGWKIPGWDYKACLPYFKKLEDYQIPYTRQDEKYHAKGGPTTFEIADFKSPLAQGYKDALAAKGYFETDFNAKFQQGFMDTPSNTRNHSRCGTYRGYIEPAMARPNLRVETSAFVTKVLFDKKSPTTATGVEYEKNGKVCQAKATREVILAAGAINSPQLLMLSGIGPQNHLKDKGIKVVKNSPGVGQNLQDHVMVFLPFPIEANVSMNLHRVLDDSNNFPLYQKYQTGPLASSGHEVIAFVSSKLNRQQDENRPNIEVIFSSDHSIRPIASTLIQEVAASMPPPEADYFSIAINLLRIDSHGTITLNSSNPHDHPLIDPRLLTQGKDLQHLREGVKIAFELVQQSALKRYGARIPEDMSPFCNSKEMKEQDYFECLVKSLSTTGLHAVGTCKMGQDKMSVVDRKLRVKGIKNLRVVDASIIPIIPAAHTNAPVMMIGEKAAEIIKADHKMK